MSTPAPQLILTFTPSGTMLVSLRDANDAALVPPRPIPVNLDYRLAAFAADMQALARLKLTSIESAAQARAGDGDPAIAVDAVHGEHGR